MSDGVITEIDGQKLKLTNLDKLIFPNAGLIKAEMIQYYKNVAPRMLKYMGGRPLTLIRFPDGIEGKKFYSKDKPGWAPEWVRDVELSDDDNKYVVAHRSVDMVWLANLAAIEIHPMQVKAPSYKFPDHFIFDLDPSPDFKFEDLKNLAFLLKAFLESKGYFPFIKTSGSKGLHIYVPIHPIYDHKVFFDSIKKMAQEFVTLNPRTCTLRMSKERRLGKVLLDIYRNHKSNSCVAPYSLRAKPHAPISMPFPWNDLEEISNSQHYKMMEYSPTSEDAWLDFHLRSVGLHDHRNTHVFQDDLAPYNKKRNFSKTDEPAGKLVYGSNDEFVIQLHDASNLHYDLRLEWDGVLLSWAIPKALPLTKEESRLAIRTENHPIKYLDFQGVIPKHEYGGGEMWIFDRGKYSMIKKEDKKIHFRLTGDFFNKEYKLINTRGKQWLLKLISEEFSMPMFEPMLATSSKELLNSQDYSYEVKWDGIRAILYKVGDSIKILSRSGSDLTAKFPELGETDSIDAESVVLDGEIVVLNAKGVSDFPKVISRMHSSNPTSTKYPVVFYAFDLLFLDGREVINEEFIKRREWLKVILKKSEFYRISETFQEGLSLYDAGREMGLEGVMLKKKTAKYSPGSRSEDWIKVKYRSEIEAYIIGFTQGSGDRMEYFGALHLAIKKEGEWQYIGKVGSGFKQDGLQELSKELALLPKSAKLIEANIDSPSESEWVEPILKCEVRFASWTSSGTLREPVFLRLIK